MNNQRKESYMGTVAVAGSLLEQIDVSGIWQQTLRRFVARTV
jgi:hypothetical protein